MPDLLNGTLDWVYSEELYGRGTSSRLLVEPRLVAHRLSAVRRKGRARVHARRRHPVPPDGTSAGISESRRSQSNGDGSASSRSRQARCAGSTPHVYSDFLIVNVGWAPDSRDVVVSDSGSDSRPGSTSTAPMRQPERRATSLRETSKAWVERWQDSSADPLWLKDGSFLWLSERSGWRHFYHYAADGTLIRQVTQGEWEIRQHARRWTPPGRGSISRRRRTARSVSTCIASARRHRSCSASRRARPPSGRFSIRRARCFSIRGATSRRRRRFACTRTGARRSGSRRRRESGSGAERARTVGDRSCCR